MPFKVTEKIENERAANIARRSPNGFNLRIKRPLNTIKKTPEVARRQPIRNLGVSFSLMRKCATIPVSIGAADTIKLTLAAVLYIRAVFSSIKLMLTPKRPQAINLSSSRKFLGIIGCGSIIQKTR